MTRRSRHARALALGLFLAGGLWGCSSGPGSRSSSAHPLTEEARELRKRSAPPPGIARELERRPAEPYVLEPGDVLLVQPAKLESTLRLPGDQVVLPDGTIQLGQYGHINVAGRTLPAIEAEVNALFRRLVPDAGPVVVRLVTRDSKVFYVLGEVNSPGAYPLRGRETVLDAIAGNAGGLTTNASRRDIILTRPTGPGSCRALLPVDYNAIVQLGDATTNYQIRAGDRVFVPTRTSGEVGHRCLKWFKKACCIPTPCFPRWPRPAEAAPDVVPEAAHPVAPPVATLPTPRPEPTPKAAPPADE